MNTAAPSLDRLTYTLPETAHVLGISERFLRNLCREGYIPALRLGRRVLIRRSTVERLLAEPQDEDARITQLLHERRELIREQGAPTRRQPRAQARR